MEFVVISWPTDVRCKSWQELTVDPSFSGGIQACQRLFRTPKNSGAKPWAPLKDLQTAYRYLDKIETTGVLGLFPWDQPLPGLIRDAVKARYMPGYSMHCPLNDVHAFSIMK